MSTAAKKGPRTGTNKSAKGSIVCAAPGTDAKRTAASSPFTPATLLEVPPEYKQQLRQAFDKFDDSGKGFIPAHEVVVALYALGYDVGSAELQQLLQEVGAAGAESIDFNDFYNVLVLKMSKKESKTESVRAFKQMDRDDKGYIGLEDLRSMSDSLHMNLTDDELSEMIQFARSVGYHTPAQGQSEFDARDMLAVSETEYLRLMKRANVY
ncbi:putative centrin [Leishmania infantum JPCM5]|uniref:Centrin_-_putative n=2 Tax=Leishmania infantum TaxID=5671 RepID=A0A6L0XRL4_LEIIN|nr:putative centrin [Leishmania infantum JPCM5]CAC9523532.1 centrin_-_putative [Leishmania infantum]CAM70800.1 putative centrin [Leishmania infantum JPCM5]SUZ44633.1 centrin_-_putative [Leishmania infantum]|eukprot:XP_001467735.1 putative centrin [Leishmania infantum JPCM5]